MKNREQGKSESAKNCTVRVFFALWPEENVCAALSELASRQHRLHGGRVMRAETLHLTLVFLGEIPVARISELERTASAVRADVFRLKLNRFTGWRHNSIGYAAPTELPSALMALSRQLRDDLTKAGFGFDCKAFKPHVTLLRKMDSMPPSQEIAVPEWFVHDFVLVQSVLDARGARYEVIGRWPLNQE